MIGQYGSKEHSYAISNIALSELKQFASNYEQESFIFGLIDKTKKADAKNRSCIMTFEYWELNDEFKNSNKNITTASYIKKDEIDRIVYTDKAIDFFTRRKNFKFNLPFSIFESMSNQYKSFNISSDIMETIKQDLHNNNMSGKHYWANRAKYYK